MPKHFLMREEVVVKAIYSQILQLEIVLYLMPKCEHLFLNDIIFLPSLKLHKETFKAKVTPNVDFVNNLHKRFHIERYRLKLLPQKKIEVVVGIFMGNRKNDSDKVTFKIF